ncbi:MAG: ACT domain-containing protein [Desulfuromonas sp.]|nr:MAG: ACT domain-containing protein [Desulfuromonas sp.]
MSAAGKIQLRVLVERFSLHRFPPQHEIPPQVFSGSFYSISRSSEELSILCPASIPLDSPRCESGWSCLVVSGPLEFSLTGILAGLSGVLAAAEISLFAVSTFDTDYLLVKSERLEQACAALRGAGYLVDE